MWMRWGGVQCSGPLGVLELCAVVHAVSLALPLGAPLGPWSGSLFTTAGWAHRAAVCEYVTAYTFLCAPCLRCYRLSLDSFSARVAMARSCARAEPEVGGPQRPTFGPDVQRAPRLVSRVFSSRRRRDRACGPPTRPPRRAVSRHAAGRARRTKRSRGGTTRTISTAH